jgi:serine/threonine protein kinase
MIPCEEPVSNSDQHVDILAAVIQRRGWASLRQLQDAQLALGPGASVNDLLDLLVSRNAIDRNQARELRLNEQDLQQIDRYTVLCRLGSGAMGTVYLGEDPAIGQRVAIKVISTKHVDDEEFVNRFEREADLSTRLDHPHIARALGIGRIAGEQLYLALEYINGPSLADLLRAHGPLPQEYTLRAAIQVAQGLDHAFNSVGLVHRDLKPENILMAKSDQGSADLPADDDQAKIIDFGLAKAINSDQSLTMTGLTMGTPHYMSPEQICGKKDLDSRTDIYGLACAMYHLLTGHTPFRGDSPGGIMMAHINTPIPDPSARVPGLHAKVRDLLIMAMAKERSERFLNFRAFINASEAALAAIGGSQAAGGVRLLRKPLVVNKPSVKRQEGSGRVNRETSSKVFRQDEPPSGSHLKNITSRIISKHEQKQLGNEDDQPAGLPVIDQDIASAARRDGPVSAEAELRRIKTDSIQRQFLAGREPIGPHGGDAGPAGPGLLPWLALLLAVSLLCYVLWF